MAKLTDARVATLQGYFDAGDQPTSAQFDQLILWIQEGIEEHDHDDTGDGDGRSALGITEITGAGVDVIDGWFLGIGAALERIVWDDAGDISVMGANFGVGTLTPERTIQAHGAGDTFIAATTTAANDCGFVMSESGPLGNLHAALVYDGGADTLEMLTGGGADPSDLTTRISIDRNAGDVTIADLAGANQPVGADAAGKLYVPHIPSDRKLKDNVKPLTGGLDVVRQLRPVTFDWNKEALADVGLDFTGCGRQTGLIAQEVVEVIPDARSNGKQYKSYDKSMITPYLIDAVKELDTRLTQLEG